MSFKKFYESLLAYEPKKLHVGYFGNPKEGCCALGAAIPKLRNNTFREGYTKEIRNALEEFDLTVPECHEIMNEND